MGRAAPSAGPPPEAATGSVPVADDPWRGRSETGHVDDPSESRGGPGVLRPGVRQPPRQGFVFFSSPLLSKKNAADTVPDESGDSGDGGDDE